MSDDLQQSRHAAAPAPKPFPIPLPGETAPASDADSAGEMPQWPDRPVDAEAPTGAIPAPPWMTSGFEYGGFWVRLAAKALDLLILAAIWVLCWVSYVGLFVLPFIALTYFPLFWVRGATPGQLICGLRIVRAAGGEPMDYRTVATRFGVELLEALAALFFVGSIAFVWVAVDEKKRAWHDIAAGTVVVHAQLYKLETS